MRSAIALLGTVLAAWGSPALAAPARESKGIERHSDFAVALSGAGEASVGGRATYEMQITNTGPDASEGKLRFNRGKDASVADFDEGEAVRTISATASQGKCATDSHGVVCRPGTIEVGGTVDIEVVIKIVPGYEPRVTVQATVAPELVPAFDTNNANDHATLTTRIRAPISVDGVPDGCASRPFKLKIATDVPKAKRTKVIVDGKVLETSTSARWSVKVDPRDLDRGPHRVTVVVQGGSGGALATLSRKFKRC
jgi:hypothetical protein